MCFFRAIPLCGRKTHKQHPPKNPVTIPWKLCLRVFSSLVFHSQFKCTKTQNAQMASGDKLDYKGCTFKQLAIQSSIRRGSASLQCSFGQMRIGLQLPSSCRHMYGSVCTCKPTHAGWALHQGGRVLLETPHLTLLDCRWWYHQGWAGRIGEFLGGLQAPTRSAHPDMNVMQVLLLNVTLYH